MNASTNNAVGPGWLSIPEAAAYTGLSERTIRQALNDPLYPAPLSAVRVGPSGGRRKIKRSDLDVWMESHPERVA